MVIGPPHNIYLLQEKYDALISGANVRLRQIGYGGTMPFGPGFSAALINPDFAGQLSAVEIDYVVRYLAFQARFMSERVKRSGIVTFPIMLIALAPFFTYLIRELQNPARYGPPTFQQDLRLMWPWVPIAFGTLLSSAPLLYLLSKSARDKMELELGMTPREVAPVALSVLEKAANFPSCSKFVRWQYRRFAKRFQNVLGPSSLEA